MIPAAPRQRRALPTRHAPGQRRPPGPLRRHPPPGRRRAVNTWPPPRRPHQHSSGVDAGRLQAPHPPPRHLPTPGASSCPPPAVADCSPTAWLCLRLLPLPASVAIAARRLPAEEKEAAASVGRPGGAPFCSAAGAAAPSRGSPDGRHCSSNRPAVYSCSEHAAEGHLRDQQQQCPNLGAARRGLTRADTCSSSDRRGAGCCCPSATGPPAALAAACFRAAARTAVPGGSASSST